MKIQTNQLVQDLTKMIQQHLNIAVALKSLPDEVLNARLSEDSWSALECIEHLNRYGNFYLPEMEKQIQKSNSTPAPVFKSGILGNYFAQSMLPKEKLNKMKTFRNMNPIYSRLDKRVLNTFEAHQKKLLQLLSQSHRVNLNKVKTAISITTWVKLRLGDTFRFVIYHNERHVQQLQKVLQQLNRQ